MDELISRAAAIEWLDFMIRFYDEKTSPVHHRVLVDVREGISEMDAVDAVPVVHGKWRDTGSGQECSVCKEIQYGYDSGRFYCPHCGAKMDKGDNDG